MNYVSDIILVTSIDDRFAEEERHNIDIVNEYLDFKHGCWLKKVDNPGGGNKVMQSDVFVGAINDFDIHAFLDMFNFIKWEHPERTQLMIKNENDDLFKIYIARNDDENN